jgi:hypothetical protein
VIYVNDFYILMIVYQVSFLVENGNALQHTFARQLQHVEVIVPAGDRVVLRKQVLWEEDAPSEDNRGELTILNSQARVESAQLHEGVVLGSEEVDIGAQLAISRPFVVRHILQEFFAAEEEDISFVDLRGDEAGGKVEGVAEEIADDNFFPLVLADVVFFNVDLLALGNAEAIDRVMEDGGGLVRFDCMHV